jgi:hypothetical protein
MRTVDMDPKSLPMLSMGQVSIISGFLFFFLIFYVSHCYSRFDKQYSASMSMEGRIFDLVTVRPRPGGQARLAFPIVIYISLWHFCVGAQGA